MIGKCATTIVLLCLLGAPPESPPDAEQAAPEPVLRGSRELVVSLLEEVDQLNREIDTLRRQLAEARLHASTAQGELDQLWQFILDHDDYGRDYEEYAAVLAVAEREARQERIEAGRELREARRAERAAQLAAARARQDRQRAESERLDRYAEAGFAPLGLDVFFGQSAFYYRTANGLGTRIRWNLLNGNYLQVYPFSTIDFSSMTISGSVLNASPQVRNIGVAVSFFDEAGNQIGAEIIQINNARPDVPYPFTATIEMALNRPFTSSTSYVLYADPVADVDHEG